MDRSGTRAACGHDSFLSLPSRHSVPGFPGSAACAACRGELSGARVGPSKKSKRPLLPRKGAWMVQIQGVRDASLGWLRRVTFRVLTQSNVVVYCVYSAR